MKTRLCLALLISVAYCVAQDIYWRPYNGVIPADAVVGFVEHGATFYIGTAPVNPKGLIVGPIVPGQRNMTVVNHAAPADKQVIHVSKYINILCSKHPDNFDWVDSRNGLDFQKIKGQFVVAGYEYLTDYPDGYPLHVGRTKHEGTLVIGKTCPWTTYYGYMYFHHKGKSLWTGDNYQTLIYRNDCCYNGNRDDTLYSPNVTL